MRSAQDGVSLGEVVHMARQSLASSYYREDKCCDFPRSLNFRKPLAGFDHEASDSTPVVREGELRTTQAVIQLTN